MTSKAFDISDATKSRLTKYVSLLTKWRNVTNLMSENSFSEIWSRHILDSVELYRQMPNANVWLDIGSGAGAPGVIVASLLADVPAAQVHCIEIDRRKCAFLREVASNLSIPLKVHNTLAEDIDPDQLTGIEVVTARAFSSISRIIQIAEPFLTREAAVILPRGRSASDEVAGLDHNRYSIKIQPNTCPGEGFFVRVELRARQSQ